MYCRNCGSELDTDRAFCDACGAIIKVDGVVLQNAVSESSVSNPAGIRGQVAQSKYVVMSVCVVLIIAMASIYTIFGKHGSTMHYSENVYQSTTTDVDLSGGEQRISYDYSVADDSTDENIQNDQSEEIESSSPYDETNHDKMDSEDNVPDEDEEEIEDDFSITENDEYLCEFSSSRLITEEEMDAMLSLNIEGLPDGRELPQMIINEIYARHGYSFKNELIQAYFVEKEWYRNIGSYSGDMDSIYSGMSDIEKDNIKLLEKYR